MLHKIGILTPGPFYLKFSNFVSIYLFAPSQVVLAKIITDSFGILPGISMAGTEH
jgi:hypothetical protein